MLTGNRAGLPSAAAPCVHVCVPAPSAGCAAAEAQCPTHLRCRCCVLPHPLVVDASRQHRCYVLPAFTSNPYTCHSLLHPYNDCNSCGHQQIIASGPVPRSAVAAATSGACIIDAFGSAQLETPSDPRGNIKVMKTMLDAHVAQTELQMSLDGSCAAGLRGAARPRLAE